MANLVFPEHTKEKLDALEYYYNLWFYIVKGQKCYLIDCNAGTGYINIRNTVENVLGSSLLGIKLYKEDKKENLSTFLIEKDKKNSNLLSKNISEFIQKNLIPAQIEKNVTIYNSDWSGVIEDIIEKTKDGIRLFFLDPFAIKSLPKDMLLSLIKNGKSEFGYKESGFEVLINWAWHAIRRKLGKYYNNKDDKSKNKDLSVTKEIKILDDYFGSSDWKKIADEFPNDIFKAKMKEKIEELRDRLVITYVKDFFDHFRFVKIHSVYSRKKSKNTHFKIRGKVKYFLIFATNYQPAIKIIDKKFKEYRDKEIFLTNPNTQTNLVKYLSNSNKNEKIKKKIKMSLEDKIKYLEHELGDDLYDKTNEIIKYLYYRKHYDYGAFDFALFNRFKISDDRYIPYLLEKNILGVRRKKSWGGYEGNYYFLCHPILIDRNEYLFFNEERYLFRKGKFVEF